MALTIHSSRSRYETINACMRMGFIQYHWAGRGIVRSGKNIYLSTGIWTHKGLEMMMKWLKANNTKEIPEYMLDHIISKIRDGYFEDIFPRAEIRVGTVHGFNLQDEGEIEDWQGDKEVRKFTDEEMQKIQQYTFNEQSALVEAMLRLFVMRVLPRWMEKYRIITIENDMSFPMVKGEGFEVTQSGTIDVALQELSTKDIFIVSYKTASNYSETNAKQNSHDIQGLSETWIFEEYLRSKGKQNSVAGVLMLHFIKRQRREDKKGDGFKKQKGPLIRGYRKLDLEGIQYAHSMYFPSDKNESGISRLGKGWEAFDIFGTPEGLEVGGIKGWLNKLNSGEIQPECGDVLGGELIEPIPYARNPQHVKSWLRQTIAREIDIATRLLNIDIYLEKKQHLEVYLDEQFPQNNKSCHNLYGGDCQYLSMCWGTEEERWKPMDGGEFEFRVPHHKAELVQIERMK